MLFLCFFPWLSGKSIIKKSKVEVPPSKVIQNDNENGEIDSDTKLYVVTSGYRLETGSIVIERGSRWESMGMPSILGWGYQMVKIKKTKKTNIKQKQKNNKKVKKKQKKQKNKKQKKTFLGT